MVLAIGSRMDTKQNHQELHAEKYHHLARAALCEVPVMDDTSIDAVHALVWLIELNPGFPDSHVPASFVWNGIS